NPQAKAPVLFQVLLLLRIVRLELAIDKLDPLDFWLGVDNKPQLGTSVSLGFFFRHSSNPHNHTGLHAEAIRPAATKASRSTFTEFATDSISLGSASSTKGAGTRPIVCVLAS